jgi:membrane protease YdiL (CAAX protease family)
MSRVLDTRRLVWWSILVGALAAFTYAGRLAGGPPPRDTLYEYETAFGTALVYTVLLGLLLLIGHGRSLRELFALQPPVSWSRAGGLAIAVLVGIWVLGGVLDTFLDAGREQGLTPSGWQPDRAGAYAANFAVVALQAPIVEELTYRGLGFTLLRPFGNVIAIGVVGLAFGLAHGLLEALPILVAFGAGLAYLRARTESIYPCIGLHALFNAIALILAVTV